MKRTLKLLVVVLLVLVPAFAQEKIKDLKPTVVLISIDGFRYDYLDLHSPPNLSRLAEKGVRARWMIPSFPTKTFPNHYTVATGLYPQNHGITDNNMYDPEFDAEFGLGKREEVQNPRWWGGEPIWVTAEKQGRTAAAYFFPGTETKISGVQPTFWRQYDGEVANETRIDTVLTWFDLPASERPTMFTLYFSDVDDAGHRFSPDAEETVAAVLRVDEMIGRLVEGFKKRGIEGKVNLIIVSDHGMVTVPARNRIVLDEMFDVSKADRVIWVGEIVQIWPKEGEEDAIYDAIKPRLPSQAKIYRKSEIPARYKYSTNRRIAPLLVLPDAGWVLVNRARADKMDAERPADSVGGSHGYDNLAPEMRALFVANGPAFKRSYLADPFSNVEVYNLMCHILGLTPAPNDGYLDNVKDVLKK